MNSILKTLVVALALAAGTAAAHADVLEDGAQSGRFVTSGGILSGR